MKIDFKQSVDLTVIKLRIGDLCAMANAGIGANEPNFATVIESLIDEHQSGFRL